MKRIYNQPAISVAQFETMSLMQVSGDTAAPTTLSITPGKQTGKQL